MRQRLFIVTGAAAAALATAAVALGGNLTSTVVISGAAGMSMSLPGNPSMSDILDGTDQVVSWSALLGVVDARGSGAGWNLSIAATPFVDLASHSIPPGAVASVTAVCDASSSCTGATNLVGYPLTVTGTATKFFDANTGTGLGKVNVTPSLDVPIPGNAYAGTYTSTVTLAAASGP